MVARIPAKYDNSPRASTCLGPALTYVRATCLVEVERHFDLHAASHRLPVGTNGGAHLPILHLREGFFFQAEAGAFDDHRVDHASIRGNDHVEQHGPHVFRLARFVGVFRLRAINTHG